MHVYIYLCLSVFICVHLCSSVVKILKINFTCPKKISDDFHAHGILSFGKILLALITLAFWGCGSDKPNAPPSDRPESPSKSTLTAAKIGGKLTLNWFPEVEHGGYFQAFSLDHPELGIAIEPGGPDIPVIQKVALGQSLLGITGADDVVNAQAQGADVVALFAPIHKNPRCLMLHADSPMNSMDQIKNITLALSSRPAFSHWLRHRYTLENVAIVPYPGSIASFVQNKNFAQQAYNISEPFLAQQAGLKTKLIMVSDLGFNPYASVLITHRKNLSTRKDELKAIVLAAQQGWINYLKNGQASHNIIHQLNPHMKLDILDFGHAELQKLCADPIDPKFGSMSVERWQTLIEQMADCGLIKENAVKADQCFNL